MKTPMKFCILSMLMVCASALTLSSQPLPRDGRLAAAADSAAKASVANAERPDRSVFIKTNPVGWGLLIGNAGVECDLNHNLSAEFWIYYSALNYFSRTTKFRTLAFTPMLKWWPGTTSSRWWADVHLGLAFFNYAKGGQWRYQDHTGSHPALGGGIGAGMRLPLGHSGRWWLEPSVGAGVYSLNYDRFVNGRNGRLESTHRKVFFGLDRVSLAVSYKFNAVRK